MFCSSLSFSLFAGFNEVALQLATLSMHFENLLWVLNVSDFFPSRGKKMDPYGASAFFNTDLFKKSLKSTKILSSVMKLG